MNIPKSSLDPFGVLGIPVLLDLDNIRGKIMLAVRKELRDPKNQWMDAILMSLTLEIAMLKTANKWLDWVDVKYTDSWEGGLVIFEARYKPKGQKPKTIHDVYYP